MPSKPRLLVAEDDPEMRLLLGRALMREGFEVETAMNGEQAHRILGERPPFQILVSDLRMPMKDGEQLLREAIRNHPDLKVIIISGYADLDDYRKLKAEGAFDCLPKPFKVPDLLELIDRALEQ